MAFSDTDTMSANAPIHPVPQLQGPFEESMAESISDTLDNVSKPDPITRRTMLLDKPTYERVCAGRWKQRPGEKYHPLWKISAQMSFGIHLLAEGLAKSDDEVMKILQTHVDDVDGFLESTTEDFDLAQSDIEERLRYLKLPLEHVEVFDRMLEDRNFRVSIVEGNEKIEHIVERTSEAMKDALKDVQKGLQATNALGKYLDSVRDSWTTRSPGHDAVFVAMVGNVEGWHRAFADLHMQGNKLGISLVQLAGIVSEMQRRAGVVSRKALLRPHNRDYASTRGQGSRPDHLRKGSDLGARSSHSVTNSPPVPSKGLPIAPDAAMPSKESVRRTSPQDPRSRQLSPTVLDPRRSQDTQREDRTTQLRNQKSAPDLKQKRKVAQRTDVNGISGLNTLGAGSGLGLSPTASLLTSRPVGPRHQTDPQMDSNASGYFPQEKAREEAPSRKPRISFSLGSRAKEKTSDNRQAASSEPGSLLKTTLSPRVAADRAANNISPVPSGGLASPDANYFSPSLSSSPRVVTPGSGRATPLLTAVAKPVNKNLAMNPTFTSHPPDMVMASSPPERHTEEIHRSNTPAKVPALQAVPDLDSKHASIQSSLGEPGPEVSAADNLIDVDEAPAIAELDSGSPAPLAPVELEAYVPQALQPVVFELEAPRQPASVAPNTAARLVPISPTSGTIRSQSDFYKLPPQQTGERVEDQSDEVVLMVPGQSRSRSGTENAALHHRSFQLPPAAQPNTPKVPTNFPNDNKALAVEIDSQEAVRHKTFQLPLAAQSKALKVPTSLPDDNKVPAVELDSQEAIRHKSFQLPSAAQPNGPKVPTNLPDDNKVPAVEIDSQEAMRHRSFQLPLNIGKDTMPTENAETLTSKHYVPEVRPKSQRQRSWHQSNLIDHISSTPPGSPIHERSQSSLSFRDSANSARLSSYRASKDLAPPEEAPPPPAPGGRYMVSPDYAAAGAFEGERRPKRTSSSSMHSIKKIFSGGSNGGHSRAGSVRIVEFSENRLNEGEVHNGVDLMMPGGNDVLWFKGMSKEGMWIAGN